MNEISLVLTAKIQVVASLSLPLGKYHPTSVCKLRLYTHLQSDFPSAVGIVIGGIPLKDRCGTTVEVSCAKVHV